MSTVGSVVGGRPPLRTAFTLAKLLLRMWDRYETEQHSWNEEMQLRQIDSARTRYHGIPSAFA